MWPIPAASTSWQNVVLWSAVEDRVGAREERCTKGLLRAKPEIDEDTVHISMHNRCLLDLTWACVAPIYVMVNLWSPCLWREGWSLHTRHSHALHTGKRCVPFLYFSKGEPKGPW